MKNSEVDIHKTMITTLEAILATITVVTLIIVHYATQNQNTDKTLAC